MIKKAYTYFNYLTEYLKHGDLISVIASIRYMLKISPHKHDRIIRTSIGKFYCRKHTNDFQFANYYYEWGVKKFLLHHVDSINVFLDVGACIGDYSVLLSKYNIQCVAFEPVRENYNALLKNLELNNLTSKVIAFPFGLGDKSKEVNFVFDPVNTGASHISAHPTGNGQNTRIVIETLDSFIEKLRISKESEIVIKLDVEGMEAEVIRGAVSFILFYPKLTFIIEEKHTGEETIKKTLSEIACFEFGTVDEYNIFAKKVSNKSSN